MLIDTRALDLTLTDAIRTYVESRVEAALGPFARRVARVRVRLENLTPGRREGPKQCSLRCSLTVSLRRRRTVAVEATADTVREAVDRAAQRARRTVWRLLRRTSPLEQARQHLRRGRSRIAAALPKPAPRRMAIPVPA